MQEKLTHFYLDQEEPLRSTLLALHDYILAFHPEMEAVWKWSTPFFLYQKKNCCYLSIDKRKGQPYLGFMKGAEIDHPSLDAGGRKLIKVLAIDPEEDLPIAAMKEIFGEAMRLLEE